MADKTGFEPPSLQNRPRIEEHHAWAWDAFNAVSSDRSFGFGPGPIPFGAIDRYATRMGIDDPDQFVTLVEILRELDRAYLKHLEDKRPKE